MQNINENWDWKKEFKEKFESEIFPAVFIQLERFISKVRVDAVGKGYREGEKNINQVQKEMIDELKRLNKSINFGIDDIHQKVKINKLFEMFIIRQNN